MTTATFCPSAQHAMATGEIAIRSHSGRVLYHLMREEILTLGDGARTLCGRYTFERHQGDEPIRAGTRLCQVCSGEAIKIRAARHGH